MKMELIECFRNVGYWNSDAGELPKRKYITTEISYLGTSLLSYVSVM